MFLISFQLESVHPAFNRHLLIRSRKYQLKINTQRVACEVLPVFLCSCFKLKCCQLCGYFRFTNLWYSKWGVYKTDLGTTVNVVKISQETLPAIQPAQIDYQRDYASLFKNQQTIYRLSPGDVLSIQLWAYPEITPPVNNISNEQSIQANGYPIDQSGYIQFPLVGRYKAAGKHLLKSTVSYIVNLLVFKNPDVVVQ